MNILKAFDFLTKAGFFFATLGELLLRLGGAPKVSNLETDEDPTELDNEYVSQDSSISRREEDEKPAEESAFLTDRDRSL